MQHVISTSEVNFVLDLLKEIRAQDHDVSHFEEEVEQAEELLEGVLERTRKEQQLELELENAEKDNGDS